VAGLVTPLAGRAALVLAVTCSAAGCSRGGELSAAEHARTACQEWRDYSDSRAGGTADTSLLPLAEDDAGLAAEGDDRYRELHDRIAVVVATIERGTPVSSQEVAAVDQACAALG